MEIKSIGDWVAIGVIVLFIILPLPFFLKRRQ